MALVMNISHDHNHDHEGEVITIEKQQISHFSHRHPLELSEIHEEDGGVCSGCEHDISGGGGAAYVCTKATCNFLLHHLCAELPRRLRHQCHPHHRLNLVPSPPYSDGEFTCDACGRSGDGFTYHCGACKFDLHVACAALPEIERRADHEHPLILVSDKNMNGQDFVCYGCGDPAAKGAWKYCCLSCKCGLHLACAENLST